MEKKQTLSSIYLARLPIEEAAALFNLTVDAAISERNEIGEMAGVALTEFGEAATAFRAQTNRSKKNQLTEKMTGERKVCTDVYGEIKKTVVFETSSRIEPRKQSANELEFFFKPNWDITKAPIGDQIDQTVKMVSLYRANPALVNAGMTIGVDALMSELEIDNIALNTTFKAHGLEDGKQGPSGTDLRPAATDSYIRFCSIIEQAANYTPNPAILELFIKIDALRKRYQALIRDKNDKTTAPSA